MLLVFLTACQLGTLAHPPPPVLTSCLSERSIPFQLISQSQYTSQNLRSGIFANAASNCMYIYIFVMIGRNILGMECTARVSSR